MGVTAQTASAQDADPRGEPVAGTAPNRAEPTTLVDVWTSEAPGGHWLHHENGWIFEEDVCRDLANNTHQVYSIDGEEFVLDEYEDWNPHERDDGCLILFEYDTPPKQVGETYPIRWEFTSLVDRYDHWEQEFPKSTVVEIVRRNEG